MTPATIDSITPRPSRRPAAAPLVLALCLSLLAPTGARALELGALHVESSLGEPLRAEVDIISTGGRDLSGVRASLANVATYERFGVPRTGILSAIEISVEPNGDGEGVVRIRSREPVHDLFLSVLLAIDDRGTRLIREVAILLDPSAAGFARRHPGGESVTTGAGASSRTVYTVEPGDSLMRIAQRLAPTSTSPEQTAVALYEANPEAFLGSIHRLIVGARLTVPGVRTIRGYPPRVARRVIRNGIERFRQRLSETTSAATRRDEDGTTSAAASTDEVGQVAASPADIASRPFGDELPLQDVQAVIVNLQGGLHDLQGTLDERIEQLDRLHARVDALIDERDALRERVERQTQREAEARAAAAMAAAAAAVAAESVDLVDLPKPIGASPPAAAARAADAMADVPERVDPRRPAGTDAVSTAGPALGTARTGTIGDAAAEPFPPAPNATLDRATDTRGSRTPDDGHPAPAVGTGEGTRTRLSDGAPGTAVDGAAATATTTADVPTPRRSVEGDGTIARDGVPLASPAAATSARTGGSTWNLARTMQAVRDGGLILLALCMVHVLFSRRFRPSDAREADEPQGIIFDPDADFEFYLHQPTDPYTKAQLLRSVLENSPQRQDMRLRLLELYASHGMASLFAEEAQIMYRMTGGKTAEWYRAVALGLELDADIDFYKVLVEEAPFDPELSLGLSDEELVASVPGGTHVGRGRDAPEGILSFEELEALHNSVARSEDGALFTKAPGAATSAGDGAAALVAPSGAGGVPDDVDATGTPLATAATGPVPLDERPVYVPEDEQELIAISVNYVYGVHRLDVDLDGDEETEDGRETNLDAALESYLHEAFDESPDTGSSGSGTAGSDVPPGDGPGSDDDAESFLVEFLDGDPPAGTAPGIADDDLLIDVEFPTDDVRLTLNLAETYVDNDHGDEARALIDAVRPRADAEQRRRADALLERLFDPRPSELACG